MRKVGKNNRSIMWEQIFQCVKIGYRFQMVRWYVWRKKWRPYFLMFQILNVFLIEKQFIFKPNVAFKRNFSIKVNYRENVLMLNLYF